VLPVVLLTVAFNAAYYLWLVPSGFFEGYLGLNAELSAVVLNVFGDDTWANGTLLSSSRFSLDVANGCDAIQVAAFYLFLVLASPVSVAWWRKILASVVGILVLVMMNLVRLVSLYYTGVYARSAFETMHLDVWQPVFIFLSLFLWVFWVWRVKRAPAVAPDATS
jgi:exosortase/archaeosortase family protein